MINIMKLKQEQMVPVTAEHFKTLFLLFLLLSVLSACALYCMKISLAELELFAPEINHGTLGKF